MRKTPGMLATVAAWFWSKPRMAQEIATLRHRLKLAKEEAEVLRELIIVLRDQRHADQTTANVHVAEGRVLLETYRGKEK